MSEQTTDQGAREALAERIAAAMRGTVYDETLELGYRHRMPTSLERAQRVLPLVDAEVAAAVSETQAERDFERRQCARLAGIADDYAAEVDRLRALVGDEEQPGWDGVSRAEAIRQANEFADTACRPIASRGIRQPRPAPVVTPSAEGASS